MKNKRVMYQGKKYILYHQYSTDFCEIQEESYKFNILLVHVSELTEIE
ncbi:hypothetical protein IEC97_07585 [Neobacillus cucumis]|nr:hypothetical protein [Neobacillus cucumis]MBI0577220.1 hypothetical protein [Neobacillus cucumis]WHY94284.1 hypothetical protein QNK12_12765 [Neobacillus cucumis]